VFFEETIELSRRVRALKLWLSLRYHGLAAYRESIAGNIRQAQLLAEQVDATPELERLAPVPLSAVNFRWVGEAPDLNARNTAILEEVNRRGRVYLSNATIGGNFALRACITNHRTTEDDVAAACRAFCRSRAVWRPLFAPVKGREEGCRGGAGRTIRQVT
jgi:glutamate/tyrosine decarboxylase-like PLP-dependent enzyme